MCPPHPPCFCYISVSVGIFVECIVYCFAVGICSKEGGYFVCKSVKEFVGCLVLSILHSNWFGIILHLGVGLL